MSVIPEFHTRRCYLRRIVPEDIPALHGYWSDKTVTRYMTICFQNIEESRQMADLLNGLAETGEGMRWTIVDQNSGRVMGSCGYHNVKTEHRRAEIGYELGREFWSRGIIQEVLVPVLNYCFTELDMNRIEAFVTEGNQRSLNTLDKLGFKVEGLLKEYEFAQGAYQNQFILSLLKRDFVQHNK